MTTGQYNKPESEFWKENWVGLSLLILTVTAAFVMFYLMTRPNQTSLDTALEGIILTVASIFASFLITSIYAARSYSKTLRDHGVQIASGIMVLKRQMEALSDWVGQKRAAISEGGKPNQPSEAILEHVEQTLLGFTGMTDTALGGIAGVIGDAFAQYETVMEQVSAIRSEALQKTTQIQQEMQTAASTEEVARLQTRIQQIATQTEKEIAKLARLSALPIPALPPIRSHTGKCPYCGLKNVFEITDRQGETQVVPCDFCGRAFNAHVTAGQNITTRRLGRLVPVTADKTEQETRSLLESNDCWIEPIQLEVLVPLVISCDGKLKTNGQGRTPYNLQTLIYQEETALAEHKISRSTVRRFMRMVYNGRGFIFERGQRPIFKSVYVNDLTTNSLLRAFTQTAIFKISTWQEVSLEDAPEFSSLLLGNRFEGALDVIKEAFTHGINKQPLFLEAALPETDS